MNKPTAAQPLDLDKQFEDAINAAYPIPDTPHTSVMQRANEGRGAFAKGWDAALIAQARADRPSVQVNLLNWALREFLGALPERRDWLNPEAESILRAVLDGTDSLARAARLDTTASASIDTPEFRALADKWQLCLTTDIERVYAELVAYIDSRAAQPVQTGVAVDERALFELRYGASAASTYQPSFLRNGDFYQHRDIQNAWLGFQLARATLAPVAAQQADWLKDELRMTNERIAAAKAPAAQAVELAKVQEQIKQGSGFWHPCSGCYDTEDGHPTAPYAYSNVFGCALGNGCSECGGIGAVWDSTDYEAMAADMEAASPASTPEASQQAAAEPMVQYEHIKGGATFKQFAKDPLPKWASNVRPYVEPTIAAAVAAPSEQQANVLPPTRGTESQQDIADAALCKHINALLALDADGALVPHGIGGHARELLKQASTRLAGAAKGGITNDKDISVGAATTSLDARNAALEEAARICEQTYVEPGDMQVAPCTEAAAAIRALKSTMRATQQEGGK